MRFADEMRGSEGERCIFTHPVTANQTAGIVVSWDDASGKAVVRVDTARLTPGPLFTVGFADVQLLGDEDDRMPTRTYKIRDGVLDPSSMEES